MNKRIAIIGCGNLGHSIANGLLNSQKIPAENIIVTRRNVEQLNDLKSKGVHVTNDNLTAVSNAEILIFALKPYTILGEIEKLKEVIQPHQILVSLATGITLEQLLKAVGKEMPVYRVMPNTASDVMESVSCVCGAHISSETDDEVKLVFNTVGSTLIINEELMEAATIMGACGVAYVLRFIRAMVQGGIEIGFDAQTASKIVNQTVMGAAKLLIENGNHPEHEIDKVTTPKGCTIVGLNQMEHNGFSSSLIKGIVSSYEKIS